MSFTIRPSNRPCERSSLKHSGASEMVSLIEYLDMLAAAVLIGKVLQSAVANASEQEAQTKLLVVTRCWVDPGPVMKRFQPKDRGKAYSIMKRTSHLCVEVGERE